MFLSLTRSLSGKGYNSAVCDQALRGQLTSYRYFCVSENIKESIYSGQRVMKLYYCWSRSARGKVLAVLWLFFALVFCLHRVHINLRTDWSFHLTAKDLRKLEVFGDSTIPVVTPQNNSYRGGHHATTEIRNLPFCPEIPSNLKEFEKISPHADLPWEAIERANKGVSTGGVYTPDACIARHRVAIIIPLRNRERQLRTLLWHMHPIWQKHMIEYRVYTITQRESGIFNRAKLLNIGVSEARKDGAFNCYVLHDVDLLLEDEGCLYTCDEDNPRQLSFYIDAFSYKPISYQLPCNPSQDSPSLLSLLAPGLYGVPETLGFGGVSMITEKQFTSVNGYSNLYWGWGGEDDDMYHRLHSRGYSVVNPFGRKCSFTMIKHEHESQNSKNSARYSLLRHARERMSEDGLKSLRYRVISRDEEKLYTNITVDIGQPSKKMLEFLKRQTWSIYVCAAKMPWKT